MRVEAALGVDDAVHQVGIEAITIASRLDDIGELWFDDRERCYRGRGSSCCRSRGIIFFEAFDGGGRDIDKAGIVVCQKEARVVADDGAPLVADGESVAQASEVGGTGRGSQNEKRGKERRVARQRGNPKVKLI